MDTNDSDYGRKLPAQSQESDGDALSKPAAKLSLSGSASKPAAIGYKKKSYEELHAPTKSAFDLSSFNNNAGGPAPGVSFSMKSYDDAYARKVENHDRFMKNNDTSKRERERRSHGHEPHSTKPAAISSSDPNYDGGKMGSASKPDVHQSSKLLPTHLQYGITLPGVRSLFASLPPDAVDQVNDGIPVNPDGTLKYPKNSVVNGYVNQFFITKWSQEDNLSSCERFLANGDPGGYIGRANIFVSWALTTAIEILLDALEVFINDHELPENQTFFWICDYVIRQTDVKRDLEFLGESVVGAGHTVLLLEPWHSPEPLKRAYCIKEVYYTQRSSCRFDMVMSYGQQIAFYDALINNFESIRQCVSEVNVRNAKCLKPSDQEKILQELDAEVGFEECNKQVVGLLRNALTKEATKSLYFIPKEERSTSSLINNLALLLQDQGEYSRALPLLEEALRGSRNKYGDRDPRTLTQINNLASLLRQTGETDEALPLFVEVVTGRRETLGSKNIQTLTSINGLASLLSDYGEYAQALELYEEALKGRRELLGNTHPHTLTSINGLATLLADLGDYKRALPLFREDLAGSRIINGDRHPDTLMAINDLASLLVDTNGNEDEALELYKEALLVKRESLGDNHPSTLTSMNGLATLCEKSGRFEESLKLFTEGLMRSRAIHGGKHQFTLTCMSGLANLLRHKGQYHEALPYLKEALAGRRETLGNDHPSTLESINTLVAMYFDMDMEEQAMAVLSGIDN